MTVKEAIARADELRLNDISDAVKAAWLFELDGRIADHMGVEPQGNRFPEEDQTLLMPYPHDGIYPAYLCAQIDNANEETALYANDSVVAENAINEALAWWLRNHRPPKGGRICV